MVRLCPIKIWEGEITREKRIQYVLHAQKLVGFIEAMRLSRAWINVKEYGCIYHPLLQKKISKYCHRLLK